MKKQLKNKKIDSVSILGYKDNSPFRFNPYNIINSGNITMDGVSTPLLAINNGQAHYLAPNSGNYKFKGKKTLEIPLMQLGGEMDPKQRESLESEKQWAKNPLSLVLGVLDAIAPATPVPIAKTVPTIGKALSKTSSAINKLGNKYVPNAYKLNPFSFEKKLNPNSFYRQVDDETFKEALESGLIKGKQTVGEASGTGKINLNRSFGDDAYYNKGDLYYGMNTEQYPYLFKVNKGEDAFIPKVNGRTKKLTTENTKVRVSKDPIPINESEMFKRDWWQGYKKFQWGGTMGAATAQTGLEVLKRKGLAEDLQNIVPMLNFNATMGPNQVNPVKAADGMITQPVGNMKTQTVPAEVPSPRPTPTPIQPITNTVGSQLGNMGLQAMQAIAPAQQGILGVSRLYAQQQREQEAQARMRDAMFNPSFQFVENDYGTDYRGMYQKGGSYKGLGQLLGPAGSYYTNTDQVPEIPEPRRSEFNEQVNWFRNYLKSPKYKERLSSELKGKNVDAEVAERQRRLEKTKVIFKDNLNFNDNANYKGAYFIEGHIPNMIDPKTGKSLKSNNSWFSQYKSGNIYLRNEYAPNNFHTLEEAPTVPVHELSHAVDNGGQRIPANTVALMANRLNGTNKGQVIPKGLENVEYNNVKWKGGKGENVQFTYTTTPSEFLARMQSLRYQLKKEGIYDAGKEDFNAEHYKKLMQNPNIQKNNDVSDVLNNLKGNYEDDQMNNLIFLMNNVAKNKSDKDLSKAQEGGSFENEEFDDYEFLFGNDEASEKIAENEQVMEQDIIEDQNKKIQEDADNQLAMDIAMSEWVRPQSEDYALNPYTNRYAGAANQDYGVTEGSYTAPKNQIATGKQYVDYLTSKGLPKHVAAGIIGNFSAESDLRSGVTNGIGAFGMGQWLGSRRTALQNFAKQQGTNPSNPQTQLDFTLHELQTTEKKALQRAMSTQTPQQAALALMNHYERPAEHEKRQSANKRTNVASQLFK